MPNINHWLKPVAYGAGAGLAGTLVLQALRTASQAWLPGTMPPIREDPGEFMIEKAEELLPETVGRSIPQPAETAIGQGLAVGYGATFGALYGALRPDGGPILSDGAGLGLFTWAVGYLGWLPAAGLMPSVRRQDLGQVVLPALQHVAYGIATVAAYDWLRRRAEPRAH